MPQATSTIIGSRKPSPQARSRTSTPAGSHASPQISAPLQPLESPISEPPLSPPPTQTTLEHDGDVQPARTLVDVMEVDEAEPAVEEARPDVERLPSQRLPSQSPAPPQDISEKKRRSRSTTAPAQSDRRVTPKSRTPQSRATSSEVKTDTSPKPVNHELPQQPMSQPTVGADEENDVKPIVETTKVEDTGEDVVMELHEEASLPLARVDLQHSTTEYVLDATVRRDSAPVAFEFKEEPIPPPVVEEKTIVPSQILYAPVTYTLPPLKALPPEFHRKGKQRQSRRRDKEKTETRPNQEWIPMGLNKWSATLRANPIHKKVSKASKCLSTREWNVRSSISCIGFHC